MTTTTNYGFTLPTVGADNDTWGGLLNQNWTDLDADLTAIQSSIDNFVAVPSGAIMLWSGAVGAIPSGYVLCDGANATPDLRDRFVIGAGSSYAVAATGGSTSITDVPSHTHSVSGGTNNSGNHAHNGSTSNSGNHSHQVRLTEGQNGGSNNALYSYRGTNAGYTSWFTQAGGDHAHNFSTSGAGDHSHSFSVTSGATGSGSVSVINPYYALCYIMKT